MRDPNPSSNAALRESKKAERRARSELEADERRREIERELAGSRIAGRINALEREAQAHLRERLSNSYPFDVAWARLYLSPSPRTVAGAHGAAPIERTTRPLSAEGTQSFHFAVVAVSRGDELRQALAAPHKIRKPSSLGASHQRYIEREGAAERLPSPSSMQTYIERGDKAEGLAPLDEQPGASTVSSFGTLSGDAIERAKFWALAEECERVPHHTIHFDPSAHFQAFERVRSSPAVASLSERTRAALARAEASTLKDVSTEEALQLVDLFFRAGQTQGFEMTNENARGVPAQRVPLKVTAGRGGVHQIRLVIELPSELSPRQRRDLAEAYCEPFAEKGLAFWAVVHAPTRANDDRNYHLHVNLYDRPTKPVTLPDGRCLHDFAYEEDQYDAKHRRTRQHRPLRQKKLGEIAHRDWPRRERVRFTKLANEAMAAAGIAKRLDPRTYKDMGIDKPARIAVPKSDYAREAKGEETNGGRELAATEWQWRLFMLACEDRARRRALLDQFEAPVADSIDVPFSDVSIHEITRWHSKQVHRGRIADEETERDLAVYMAERLSSRARLKKPADRDPIDREGLALAEEFRRKAAEHSATLARLKREAVELEAELDVAISGDLIPGESADEHTPKRAVRDPAQPIASTAMRAPESSSVEISKPALDQRIGLLPAEAEVQLVTIPMPAPATGIGRPHADRVLAQKNRTADGTASPASSLSDQTQKPTTIPPIVRPEKTAGTRTALPPNMAQVAAAVHPVQQPAAKPGSLPTTSASRLETTGIAPAARERLARTAAPARLPAGQTGRAPAKLPSAPTGLPMMANVAGIVWRTNVNAPQQGKGGPSR